MRIVLKSFDIFFYYTRYGRALQNGATGFRNFFTRAADDKLL